MFRLFKLITVSVLLSFSLIDILFPSKLTEDIVEKRHATAIKSTTLAVRKDPIPDQSRLKNGPKKEEVTSVPIETRKIRSQVDTKSTYTGNEDKKKARNSNSLYKPLENKRKEKAPDSKKVLSPDTESQIKDKKTFPHENSSCIPWWERLSSPKGKPSCVAISAKRGSNSHSPNKVTCSQPKKTKPLAQKTHKSREMSSSNSFNSKFLGKRIRIDDSQNSNTLILDSLPVEILCHIAEFLELEDFYHFKNISTVFYNISTSPMLSISGEQEEISHLFLSHQSVVNVLLKVLRTPKGFKQFLKGYERLLEDSENLKELASSTLGISQTLPYMLFATFEKSITPYVAISDSLPRFHILRKIDTFLKVSQKMRQTLETEANSNKPVPQLNLGLYHLIGGQLNLAQTMFEKAITNGSLEAYGALGLSSYLLGEEEKGCLLMSMLNFDSIKSRNIKFGLSFNNLIDSIIFYNFCVTRSKEAARLFGMWIFSRGDYRRSEKILLASRDDSMSGAEFLLGKLYNKTRRFAERDQFLLCSAKRNNLEAQIMLGRSLLESGHAEEAYYWFQRACEKETPMHQACAAYKLAKIAINRNDPTHPVLKMVKECFSKLLEHAKLGRSQSLGHVSLKDAKTLTALKIEEFQKNSAHNEFIYTIEKLNRRAVQSYEEGDKEKAKSWWEFIVEYEEKPVALNNLGSLAMERGDEEEAKKQYYEAAKQGFALAVKNIFVNGCLMYKDNKIQKAKEWLSLAAEFNNSDAELLLSVILNKLNQTEDARDWAFKSASKGNIEAIKVMLAISSELYSQGRKGDAKRYLEVAAFHNNPEASFQLGVLETEEGNQEKALEFFFKAASLGNQDAINNLMRRGYLHM